MKKGERIKMKGSGGNQYRPIIQKNTKKNREGQILQIHYSHHSAHHEKMNIAFYEMRESLV